VKRKKSARPAATPRSDRVSSNGIALSILIVLTIVVYWNSLDGDFVFDDQQIVMQNPLLLNIHTLSDVVRVALGWRQLLFFSYGLNFYWSGLHTFGYHAINLLLHVVNTILVYFIIVELIAPGANAAGRQPGNREAHYAAFAGAAVFSVHTLLSSAVSYIAGRSSVLCGLFYFLATLLFLKTLKNDISRKARIVYLSLAALSGILAWQAKQEAITLPALLAALLWLRSDKRDLRYVAVLAALPAVLAASMWSQLQSLFATVMGNRVLVNAGFDATLQPATYFRTYIASVVGYYLPRFVFPARLSADPHVLAVEHWYSPEFIFAACVLAVLAWLMIRPRSSNLLFTAGLAAILISPLMAYALVPLADVVLEHRAYIPGLGIALLSTALFRWSETKFHGLRVAGPVVVVLVLGVMTIQRNTVFASNVSLWQDAIEKSPQKARPHFNLGAAYQNARRPNDAIREYQTALSLKPDIHAAYSNMAAIQIDSGQLDEGEKTLVKLTQLAPDYTEGFINLSVLYLRKKETEKAITAVDRAIAINPDSSAAHFNKAEALTQKGDYKSAVDSYERAAYLRPDLNSFRLSLGNAYFRAGDFKKAEAVLTMLTEGNLAPDAYQALGRVYTSSGQPQKAVDSLKRAIGLRANFPTAHHDLGVIYLGQRQTDAAIDEFRTTVMEAPDFAPGILNLSLAYQTKGDLGAARQVLENYLTQFANRPSEYLQQIQSRLAALRQPS
jgi:protein O-mannosyl-transferase